MKTPNTIEDIETFIDENRQHHPELPDDQGEASHRELEELSTLEEENITEEQNEDDVVIGDQLADALDLIQNIVSANLEDERVKKATRHFVKKILNAKTKLEMINLLHGIGNEVAAPEKNGKKIKKRKINPCSNNCKIQKG